MLEEILMLVFSSAGVMGSVAAILMATTVRDYRKDLNERRKERIILQQLQSEGEERLAMLVLALVKFSKGEGRIKDVEDAEAQYKEYNERSRDNTRKMISVHTV